MDKYLDIERIKRKFDVVYDYFNKKGSFSFGLDEARLIVKDAYNNKKVTIMKRVEKELDVWIKEIPQINREELVKILNIELEDNFDNREKKKLKKIDKILNRGEINTNEEYELLLKRVEEIYTDNKKEQEIGILNKLLAKYHK